MPIEISIIVPVFDEADNVLPLMREIAIAMSSVGRSWELMFVDDASSDMTWERIREAHRLDTRVIGLRHLRNAGQSAALWTGIRGTSSPIIATLDGDLQNDPADIPKMLSRLDEYDFVSGMRINRHDTFVRRVSSRIARNARQTMLGADFRDTGCAMRVFKRSALEGVFPFNGLHRFLPILVSDGGAKTIEVPVNHRPRAAGVSKYGIWNRLGRGIYDLIAIAWYQKRRYRPVPFARLELEPEPAGSIAQ